MKKIIVQIRNICDAQPTEPSLALNLEENLLPHPSP